MPKALYGTAPVACIPVSYIHAGIAQLDPTVALPGLRRLFDVTSEEGRAGYAAFHAARERNEASMEEALSRAGITAAVPVMQAEIARVVAEALSR